MLKHFAATWRKSELWAALCCADAVVGPLTLLHHGKERGKSGQKYLLCDAKVSLGL